MSGKKKYSDELKLQIVMEYLEGKNGGLRVLATITTITVSRVN